MTDTPAEREEGGAWAKLRRRKVVQWGLAYGAGAWGLLQGLSYVVATFHWPVRIQQLATVLLLIGVPIALVVAWYHGDRGERRVTRTELAILTLLFLVGGGLFWRYQHSSQSTPAAAVATTTTSAPAAVHATSADARPSIAVLPFDNRSKLEDDVYFVDGIHDDILTQLSKVSGMRVISRTSVEQFRDTKLAIKSIAEQLGVAQVLEGGVQRAGDRVRVTVQLIDAATDAHLWAETYDRELTAANIFAIQSEVATAIAGALKATLTTDEKTRLNASPTQNLAAWEAYQLGKQRMARRTGDALAEAERFFREAIELDPAFSLAHVGLADVLRMQHEYSGVPLKSALAQAEPAVARALALDPSSAEAWASAAAIEMAKQQLDRSESMFQRAIGLNPNLATARHWYSLLLRDSGRLDEALAQIEQAVAIDPLSSVMRDVLGGTLEAKGRFPEAMNAYRKALTIDPLRPGSYRSVAHLLAYTLGRPADAVPFAQKAMELDPGNPGYAGYLGWLHFDLGNDADAGRLLSVARKIGPDDYFVLTLSAFINEARGDQQGAVHDAERLLASDSRDAFGLALLRDNDLQAGRPELALARYAQAYPELVETPSPTVDASNWIQAMELAPVFQTMGAREAARVLLDRSEQTIQTLPRLGQFGYQIEDVRIHALRGDKVKAVAALREAATAGWRSGWRYYRDFDPALASIRDEPEFKAVFSGIERDMARQRAELAARPKDAPLDLGESPG
ncbi:MAG: tetratricopeptide repeat protein [Steroidobacteraceae bacterium]|nr:tetratricopeptide repeat protein [Steroidobacteraceae bacterium]